MVELAKQFESVEVQEVVHFDPEEIPELKHSIEKTPMSDAERIDVRIRDNVKKLRDIFDWNEKQVVSWHLVGSDTLTLQEGDRTYVLETSLDDGWSFVSLKVLSKGMVDMSYMFSERAWWQWSDARYEFTGEDPYIVDIQNYSDTIDIDGFRRREARFQQIYTDLLS